MHAAVEPPVGLGVGGRTSTGRARSARPWSLREAPRRLQRFEAVGRRYPRGHRRPQSRSHCAFWRGRTVRWYSSTMFATTARTELATSIVGVSKLGIDQAMAVLTPQFLSLVPQFFFTDAETSVSCLAGSLRLCFLQEPRPPSTISYSMASKGSLPAHRFASKGESTSVSIRVIYLSTGNTRAPCGLTGIHLTGGYSAKRIKV